MDDVRTGVVLAIGTGLGAVLGGGMALQLDFSLEFVLIVTFACGLSGGGLLVLLTSRSLFVRSKK